MAAVLSANSSGAERRRCAAHCSISPSLAGASHCQAATAKKDLTTGNALDGYHEPSRSKVLRPLTSYLHDDALMTVATVLQQTQEARGMRRAQAVREVVDGHHINSSPPSSSVPIQRFAMPSPQGLQERPHPGRPTPPPHDLCISTASCTTNRANPSPARLP